MDIHKKHKTSNPLATYNIRERLVRCLICDRALMTDAPAPKCEICGSNMITVIIWEKKDADGEN